MNKICGTSKNNNKVNNNNSIIIALYLKMGNIENKRYELSFFGYLFLLLFTRFIYMEYMQIN